jgi:hypothetical protein
MAKHLPDQEPERIPVRSAIVLTAFERLAALGLLAFGTAPLILIWIKLFLTPGLDEKLWIDLTILGLFAFVAIETISLIVLRGFRRIDLSDATMKWLGAAALTEVGGLLWYIVKHKQ